MRGGTKIAADSRLERIMGLQAELEELPVPATSDTEFYTAIQAGALILIAEELNWIGRIVGTNQPDPQPPTLPGSR